VLDLGSDDEVDEPQLIPSKQRKSKQHIKPAKIIPTGSDISSSDAEDSDEDDDGHITMANMEARSRALDAKAALEANLDAEEMQLAALGDQNDDEEDVDMDGEIGNDDEDDEVFQLPNAAEREEEKKTGGPDVHIVQRRMRECVRVLGNFKGLAAKERYAEWLHRKH
jgi:ribosomal RNA methyltransferase Nop2